MDELALPRTPEVVSEDKSVNTSGAGALEDKSRVQHFDNSHSLRRGDVVVVRQSGGANVGKIAVSANGTGLFKRGGAVEALYVLGEDRYLVTCEAGLQIVRGDEIFATVAAAQPR